MLTIRMTTIRPVFFIAALLLRALDAHAGVKIARLDCGQEPQAVSVASFSDTMALPDLKIALTYSCYLIRNGDKYLIWDTGLQVGEGLEGPSVSITDQLKRGGLTPTILKLALTGPLILCVQPCASFIGGIKMYGLIGNIKAKPGKRDLLIPIPLEGVSEMPGCISYVVSTDSNDGDGIWITEVWKSLEAHKASLSLKIVHDAIERSKPLIESFGQYIETSPVGGRGIGS